MGNDTAELDLSYVEAERIRQLSERSGASPHGDDDIDHIDHIDLTHLDPASRAEAIVAEVLADAQSIDELIAELDIDLDRSAGLRDATERPVRTHVAMLGRDPALLLLPGEAFEPDAEAFTPDAFTPDDTTARARLGPLVERALAPLYEEVRLLTAHQVSDRTERSHTARWILVAAVWAAAMAAMLPLALGLVGSSIDMRIDLFPEDEVPPTTDTAPDTAPEDTGQPAGTIPGQTTP